MKLSEQATTILQLIAAGRSYDQFLQRHPELTYFDIFAAAREVLETSEGSSQPNEVLRTSEPTHDAPVKLEACAPAAVEPTTTVPKLSFIDRARATHARAWARWAPDEDTRLTSLIHLGASRASMGEELGRQPGAVRSRLLKLGLISEADEGIPGTVANGSRPTDEGTRPVGEAAPIPAPVPGWEAGAVRQQCRPARVAGVRRGDR